MSGDYLRKDLAARWAQVDVFQQIDRLQGTTFRSVGNRRTTRVKVGGEVFFLKRHGGVGWLEIFKNLLSLRLPVIGAHNEFAAARALSAAGVSVPEPVAYARRGLNPANQDSFLLSKAIEPSTSLEDLVAAWSETPPSWIERRRLLDAVAKVTRQLHANGVNHRDLYICHFLLHPDSWPAEVAGGPQLTLIDLHRAQLRVDVPTRWLVKDLGALLFSTLSLTLSRGERFRFIQRYSGSSLREELGDARRAIFWDKVAERADKLYAEGLRKGLIEG